MNFNDIMKINPTIPVYLRKDSPKKKEEEKKKKLPSSSPSFEELLKAAQKENE